MSKATLKSLLLSLVVLSIGTAGGVSIAWKLSGSGEAAEFMHFGVITQLIVFMLQLFFYGRARRELFFQLYYLASCSLTMVWTMLALFLPIFWLNSVGLKVKLVMILISLILFFANFAYAVNHIQKQWVNFGANKFEKIAKNSGKTVAWNKVVISMNIMPVIYVPAMPQSWSPFFGAYLVFSMIAGLNLRVAYPIFAIFATGIPCIICASFFMQMSGYYFKQASIVKSIETERCIKIKSTD